MLFFCAWDRDDGPTSLVVHARDKAHAEDMASHVHSGDGTPARCVPWEPGVFVCEVVEREDDEGVTLVLEPLEHTETVLDALDEDKAAIVALDDALRAQCESEAEDEGRAVRCVQIAGHDGDHQSADGGTWE